MGEEEDDKASGDVTPQPPPPPTPPKIPDVELIVDGFGFMPKGDPRKRYLNLLAKEHVEAEAEDRSCASSSNIDIVRRYTWKTKNRMTVQVITYGATITSIQVPDRKGNPDDVVAGFDTLEEYFQPANPYFGATIGRCANYIREATMCVRPSGRMYLLSNNRGHHHYHGGFVGFDKINWRSFVDGNKVIMSHVSERFDQGYPGTLMAQLTFEVTCDNTLKIEMKCTSTEPTIVNLSNSPFFNLAGHNSGKETLYDHIITINGDKYTAMDEDGIITGEKKVVGGTPYDFRIPRMLRCMLPKVPMGGYDLNYCITQGVEQDLTFQARALHPVSGRVLEVYSNQPGMQFYTGNLLPDPDKIVEMGGEEEDENEKEEVKEVKQVKDVKEEQSLGSGSTATVSSGKTHLEEEEEGVKRYGYVPLNGKLGATYKKHGLFAMSPQNYPDAVNNVNFPKCVLNPGETYIHRIQYKFGLLFGRYF